MKCTTLKNPRTLENKRSSFILKPEITANPFQTYAAVAFGSSTDQRVEVLPLTAHVTDEVDMVEIGLFAHGHTIRPIFFLKKPNLTFEGPIWPIGE